MENIIAIIANFFYIMHVFLSIATASRSGLPAAADAQSPVPGTKGAAP
jgi:hypothetical protein